MYEIITKFTNYLKKELTDTENLIENLRSEVIEKPKKPSGVFTRFYNIIKDDLERDINSKSRASK